MLEHKAFTGGGKDMLLNSNFLPYTSHRLLYQRYC